jgi:hypothetical protein
MKQTFKSVKPIKPKPPEIKIHSNGLLNTINKEFNLENSKEEVKSATGLLHLYSFEELSSPSENVLDCINELHDEFNQETSQEISKFIANLDLKEEVIPSKKRKFEIPRLRGFLPKKCSNEKCKYFQNKSDIEVENFETLKGNSTRCICGYPVRYFIDKKWVSSSFLSKNKKKKLSEFEKK